MKTSLMQIRVTPEDKVLFAEVATLLQRSQSDAVRFVMREKLQAIKEQDQPTKGGKRGLHGRAAKTPH